MQWNLEQIKYTVYMYVVILPKYLDVKELGLRVRECTCLAVKNANAHFLITILPYLPRASEVTVNLFRAFIQIK